jgi:hypothetical protein
MSLLPALAAVALQSASSTDDRPLSITREQAMRLPPREVGRIVLGLTGALVREVSRPIVQGVPYPDERLQTLAFGLQPETLLPGLCRATAIYVSFGSDAPAQEPAERGRQLPVRVTHVSTHEVYKVVGELADSGTPFGPGARASQLVRCRDAQVVTTETLDFDQPRYFAVGGPLLPALAAGILQKILTDAAAGALTDLRCDPGSTQVAPCTDPRLALRDVTLDRLTSVESTPAGGGRYIVSAGFSDPANPDRQMVLGVRAEVTLSGPSHRLVSIQEVTVTRSAILF